MGSWNGTCGITQLPITAGQRIALIPLIIKQHDFLARDSLAGSGACSNDVIAQPFSMPLFGEYDDYGGIALDENQPGEAALLAVFEKLVGKGRLMRTPQAKPVPVETANIELLEEMLRRELIYQVNNPRKAWLKQLHETFAGLTPEQQGGMDHYKPQMEVNLDTLPDMLDLGMGAMMVHEELYFALAEQAGKADSFGYWDDAKSKLIEFKGDRRGELESFLVISDEQRERVAHLRSELEGMYAELSAASPTFTPARAEMLLAELPLSAIPKAMSTAEDLFFFPFGVKHVLAQASGKNDETARQLWVNFMLFNSAFISLRKLWTPQTGAGSSAGLGDFHDIYKVQSDFMAKTMSGFYERRAAYEAEAAAREAARKAAKPKKPRTPKKKPEAQS